jgi:membrane-bound serine protease (ClpP class)
VKVVSYGMLSVGGIVSLFLGSIMLFETAEPYYRLSLALVAGVTVFTALFFMVGLFLVVRAQKRKPTTGMEGLIGEKGVVTVALDPEGKIKTHGEIWTARSEESLPVGADVRITAAEGMKLKVEKEKEKEIHET